MHASASPAEALFERMNWLGASCDDDIFGASMLGAGISKATVEEWSQDPQVPFDGRNQSLFDLLEDMDAKDGGLATQRMADVNITSPAPIIISPLTLSPHSPTQLHFPQS